MTFLYSFILCYALWLFYLAVMNLKRARDANKLTLPSKIFGYPILFIGLFLDFLVNVTICTVAFVEFPKETLVTGRLMRHAKQDTWRGKLSRWICKNLLDAFDPSGCHCQ